MKKKILQKKQYKEKVEGYEELIDFIGNKFDNVDKRLDNVDKRFDDVDDRLNELGEMFRDLQGAVDSYAKRADTYFQEMVMLSHQISRHDRWIRKIAEKIGVKLES